MKKRLMILKSMSLAAAMAVLGVVSTAQAHHSAAYIADFTKQIEVKGIFSMVKYANPHCEFRVDVKGADGKVVVWTFGGPPPSFLQSVGVKKEDFTKHIGEEVTVTTFASRDGSPNGFFKKIVYKDGTFFHMDITPNG